MRNNFTSCAIALFAIFSIVISGCGGDSSIAPVSGTVTYDGKPVAKLGVFFSPEPVGENFSPGPYSKGTTDADGKFTLVTRHKDPGAFVGSHKLTFQYTDIGETEMDDLRDSMSEAKEYGDKAAFEKAKKKMAKITAKLKGRPVLRGVEAVIEVPAGGHEDLQLDLGELMNKPN
jgi:hypothetical protein